MGWDERDLLRDDGREWKESSVACGSLRDCWVRKESRPSIDGVDDDVGVGERKRRTRRMVALDIFSGGVRADEA